MSRICGRETSPAGIGGMSMARILPKRVHILAIPPVVSVEAAAA